MSKTFLGNEGITKLTELIKSSISSTLSTLRSEIAAKANTSHTHDDRYYTETEVNTLLNEKADVTSVTALQEHHNDKALYCFPVEEVNIAPHSTYSARLYYSGGFICSPQTFLGRPCDISFGSDPETVEFHGIVYSLSKDGGGKVNIRDTIVYIHVLLINDTDNALGFDNSFNLILSFY